MEISRGCGFSSQDIATFTANLIRYTREGCVAETSRAAEQEEALVRRVRGGDTAAFTRLVELCAPRVYNLAYRMVNNTDDAQDIAQEAFLRVYQALPSFKGDAAFSTWLYRIVVNACYDELKRRGRRPATFSDLETDDGTPTTDTLTTGESAEDRLLTRERQGVVQAAIRALPEPFRLVLVLYDVQGVSYQEIADILHTNIGTVKSRLNRARNQLREKLAEARELFPQAHSRKE